MGNCLSIFQMSYNTKFQSIFYDLYWDRRYKDRLDRVNTHSKASSLLPDFSETLKLSLIENTSSGYWFDLLIF